MGTDLEAGGFLCHSACRAADENLPEAFEKAVMAKYFTSRAAVRAASDAVQIRGAAGCHGSSPVSRFYRDAKIMEIIEGTTQIHEHLLGGMFVRQARRSLQLTLRSALLWNLLPNVPPAKQILQRIAEFNRTEAPFPDSATLQELIEAQFVECASATAVICDHDKVFGVPSLSCAELNEKANQLARSLRATGVGPGHIVALMVERSFAMMIGILGIIKSGAAYLPLSPDNPPARTDYMLKDAERQSTAWCTPRRRGRTTFDGMIVNLDDPGIYLGPKENPIIVNQARDLAYVIYTSGSTGKPKGVMIEHRSVVNRLHWMQHAYPIDGDDVILQKTPYYFDVSVWELFWWALQGAKLCFLMPRGEGSPLAIIETIRKHRVTVLHFVPSMLNVFLEYLDGKDDRVLEGLASVRRVFVSGEALTPSHVRKFNNILSKQDRGALTNLYGPTEATVDVSYYDCPSHNDFETVPIGRPIHNIKLYVMRDGGRWPLARLASYALPGWGLPEDT